MRAAVAAIDEVVAPAPPRLPAVVEVALDPPADVACALVSPSWTGDLRLSAGGAVYASITGAKSTVIVPQGRAAAFVTVDAPLALRGVLPEPRLFLAKPLPLGGFIADRTGRNDAVLLAGNLAFAVLLAGAARAEAVILAFVALGLASGIAAGPIMSLPVRVLPPEMRAVGMGMFFTLFYLLVVLAPWVAGHLATFAGSARITFDFGAAMLAACCLLTLAFIRLSRRPM